MWAQQRATSDAMSFQDLIRRHLRDRLMRRMLPGDDEQYSGNAVGALSQSDSYCASDLLPHDEPARLISVWSESPPRSRWSRRALPICRLELTSV